MYDVIVTTILDDRLDEIRRLCSRFGVARLEVFGSAASDAFDPSRSDVDLLVEFASGVDLGPWLGHYFEFRDAMERLLGRPVDLVMNQDFRNPAFAQAVERSRRLLYAA